MAKIPIYGTLVNATTDPKIVNTDQAWDKELGKYQSEINKERIEGNDSLKTQLDTLSSKVDKEITDRGSADTALGAKIDKEIQDRTTADTALKTELTDSIQEVRDDLDTFKATKGQANGLASLDSNGKVPAAQLPSYVDDVIDVYATYKVSPTNQISNIKLYSDAAHANPVTGEAGKSYNDITEGHPGYQFRWSGTTWVPITSGGLIIGEISGTAYDGAKGKTTTDELQALKDFNPVRLVSITTEASKGTLNYEPANGTGVKGLDILAASSTKAGVMTAADKVKLDTTLPNQIAAETAAREAAINALQGELADDIAQEVVDRNTAIAAAKTELTTVINKEVSDRKAADTQVRTDLEAAVELVAEELRGADTTLQNNITKEVNDRKGEVTRIEGLISDEAATRAQADTTVNAKVDSHIGNKSNPHGVTRGQLGLGNVNNTSDADKPVSTAQATAIADAKAAGTKAQTDLSTHANRRDNPHNVTRAQLGLATTDQVVFAKTTAASGFWKESDGRLKSQVENLNHTLDQICNIPTVHFKMNGKYQVGTIAQSLEEIEPLLVSENTIPASQVPNQSRFETFVGEDGQEYVKVKVVEYEMLSVMALEGVKLLRKEFEDFKKQLNNK
jgi:hypothetical protein